MSKTTLRGIIFLLFAVTPFCEMSLIKLSKPSFEEKSINAAYKKVKNTRIHPFITTKN